MRDNSHRKISSYKWKNLNQAQPGSLHLLPQEELATLLSANYTAMQGMILDDAPPFDKLLDAV